MKTTANVSASMQSEVNHTPKDHTFHINKGINKLPNISDSTARVSDSLSEMGVTHLHLRIDYFMHLHTCQNAIKF
jgi:hypothetical protein